MNHPEAFARGFLDELEKTAVLPAAAAALAPLAGKGLALLGGGSKLMGGLQVASMAKGMLGGGGGGAQQQGGVQQGTGAGGILGSAKRQMMGGGNLNYMQPQPAPYLGAR